MKVFLDLETTGIDTHGSEIVEIYMVSRIGALHLLNKPKNWSTEAEAIHGITWDQVVTKPTIETTMGLIFNYLRKVESPIEFWCYSNTNNFGTHCHFDVAIIEYQCMLIGKEYEFRHITKGSTRNSVWQLAKDKLPRLKGGYSQANVAKYLGIEYDAHKAKDDVMAMIAIYKSLIEYGHQEVLTHHPR